MFYKFNILNINSHPDLKTWGEIVQEWWETELSLHNGAHQDCMLLLIVWVCTGRIWWLHGYFISRKVLGFWTFCLVFYLCLCPPRLCILHMNVGNYWLDNFLSNQISRKINLKHNFDKAIFVPMSFQNQLPIFQLPLTYIWGMPAPPFLCQNVLW